MTVTWKDPSDPQRLRKLIANQSNAKQRDRYRVVLIGGEGLGEKDELYREQIGFTVERSRQFVDEWVSRHRPGGIEALLHLKQPGRTPKLTEQQQQQLCVLLET